MKPNRSIAERLKRVLSGIGLMVSMGFAGAAEETVSKPGVTNAVPVAGTNAPAGGGTNSAPAAAESGPTSLDYSAFRQIADRNIFNAGRSSRSARSGERPRQVQVDTFTVVGTMSYAKGDVAFFDGSSGAYRKAVKLGESIAGHKVIGITAEEVQLEAGEQKVTLKVGGQMRREDEGPWSMSAAGVSHAVTSSAPGTTTGAAETADGGSDGEVSDVLKRLLQKRAQEEKNENQ
jgi:hypothetical protein